MPKKFPILFPDLRSDFELIKGSSDDPDETDYEWNEGNHEYYFEDYHLVLSQNNSILLSDYTEFFDLGCSQFSGTFYFQITGLFEDELIPSGTGDLNDY